MWLLDRRGGKPNSSPNNSRRRRFCLVARQQAPCIGSPGPIRRRKEEAEAKKKCDADDKDCKAKKNDHTLRAVVVDRYRFKEDEIGYLDRRRKHLYVFDIVSKTLTQITSGDYDEEGPAWSPDGKQIAFTSNRSTPDPDRTPDSNIWVVAADNTDKGAHLTQVTTNPGEDESPTWSPDGKWIAYITQQLDPKLYIYATHHVGVSPATGGEAKVLTKAFDRMASLPRFAPDGKSIYFIADDDGTQNLCSVPVAGGEVTRPIGGRLMLYYYSVAKSGEFAAQITTPDFPSEIFTVPGGKLTRISHTNDDTMKQVRLVAPEYLKFKSKDGTTVTGYVYKPLDYTPGKKYPTLLRRTEVRCGLTMPSTRTSRNSWPRTDTLCCFLIRAAQLDKARPTPTPSTLTGATKIFKTTWPWSTTPSAQGMTDPGKLGVFGWSYGGISTDFIIAQTNRFKAAISGAGASLFGSLYGHDRYVRDYDYELGHPWDRASKAAWDRVSMYSKVESITTPVMFQGGDIDWNVPILGGEQMYQALKVLGR